MPYEVHLDVYDGPFDLLLHLITAQEVDLYEISLVEIVDAFVAEIARMERVDLESTTEFLLIAATLIELKCKRLLPGSDDIEIDDDLALLEARDYLLARLVEAKMFSGAGRSLHALELSASRGHARRAGADEQFSAVEPDLLAGITKERIAEVARAALEETPPERVEISHVHVDEVSVHDTFDRLVHELPEKGSTTLGELGAVATSTAAFVAIFLAVLELYKQHLVELEQQCSFGEVTVAWIGGMQRPIATHDEYDDVATPGHLVNGSSLPSEDDNVAQRQPDEIDREESSESGSGAPDRAAIEAILIAATEPVTARLLAQLLEVAVEKVEALCVELARAYEAEERGFQLVRVAGGYRFQSHPAYAGYVERFILDDAPQRLSPAALETLAIVAYKQPISRAQIAQIRGVNADGVVRMLTERGYIAPIGRDDGPGLAVLFGTTTLFLERLGLDRIEELPPLGAFVPDALVVEGLERILRTEPDS